MKNIDKIIENEHKIVNRKDIYGLAKKRARVKSTQFLVLKLKHLKEIIG